MSAINPSPPPETSSIDATTRLVVRADGEHFATHPLSKHNIIVGRSSQADVKLEGPTISRRHSECYRDPFGRWWIRDLQSRNGTKVNGVRVTESLLKPGDDIQIGKYEVAFVTGDQSEIEENDFDPSLTMTSNMRVSDLPGTQISTLSTQQSAMIDTSHLATLTEFAHRLMQTDDIPERRRLLCRLMVRRDFHGDAAVMLRMDRVRPTDPPQVLCEPQSLAGMGDTLPYVSRTVLTTVTQTEAPVLASSDSHDPGAIEMSIVPGATERTCVVACPVKSTPKSIDILYVTLPPDYGTAQWLALVTLASQQFRQVEMSLIARREAKAHADIEKELEKAREIQLRLVPNDAEFLGLDAAVGFEPCKWVGGDYADIVKTHDDKILLVTADVSGKGLPAALVTSSLHTLVHASVRINASLEQLLTVLNDHLVDHLDPASFVTLVAVEFDPSNGSVRCINAGHPPVFILDTNGESRKLQFGEYLPLGITPQELTPKTYTIQPGELLAMYTDGLTELRDDADEEIGIDRLSKIIANLYAKAPNDPIDWIRRKLNTTLNDIQADRVPLDDRTFLLARRTG